MKIAAHASKPSSSSRGFDIHLVWSLFPPDHDGLS